MRHVVRMVVATRFALSTRRDLLLEILALRHQLHVLGRSNRLWSAKTILSGVGAKINGDEFWRSSTYACVSVRSRGDARVGVGRGPACTTARRSISNI